MAKLKEVEVKKIPSMVRVKLELSARGTIEVEMTQEQFDERFPEGGRPTCDLDDIIQRNWSDVVENLDFEIDDAYVQG